MPLLRPLPLYTLALCAFAIGTTEFVIMGLLPEVATDLGVSIPAAGWLITGYALGVALGAPLMVLAVARLPRRSALVALMGIFIVGNLLCALAGDYALLMLARVVTSLCHGAFFGIGAVVAAGLVPFHRRTSALALMFSGLTLANVLGVPLGTALGQALGWRATFWAVSGAGVVALAGLLRVLPHDGSAPPAAIRQEIAALRNPRLGLALLTTVTFSASMFALFTYVAPLLREVSGVSPAGVAATLFVIGLGLTLGNYLGGRLGDRNLTATLAGAFLAVALTAGALAWTSQSALAAQLTLFLWAMATFALVPGLQANVVNHGHDAPNLVSTLNIAAFNVGNALGAWIGGAVLGLGLGLTHIPLAAAAIAVGGFVLVHITARPAT